MPEKEAIAQMTALSLGDKILWMTIGLFIVGSMARTLISDEPFILRKFLGEMLFALIGAVVLWSFGLLQGMSPAQIVFLGGLGSLGGIRLLEWILRIAKQIKSNT